MNKGPATLGTASASVGAMPPAGRRNRRRVVLANKAMLPLLWKIFPNHPYLLNSQYELTGDFDRRGYVTKPIAGCCGVNISLFDTNDNLLTRTRGGFNRQDQV